MASVGTQDFFRVRWRTDTGANFEHYPLYGRFKITDVSFQLIDSFATDSSGNTIPGLLRVSYGGHPIDAMYWQPFSSSGNLDFYKYTEGDEHLDLKNPKNSTSLTQRNPVHIFTAAGKFEFDFAPGTTKLVNNEAYSATQYRVLYTYTLRSPSTNPYSSAYIRVWMKPSDLKEVKTLYWYDPKSKTFFAFPQSFYNNNSISAAINNAARQSLANAQSIYLLELKDTSLTEEARRQMIEARVQYLMRSGYSESQARAALGQGGAVQGADSSSPTTSTSVVPRSGSVGTLGRGSTDNGSSTSSSNQTSTTVTLRGRFGYVAPGQDPRVPETDDFGTSGVFPQMVQYFSNDGLNPEPPRRFTFFLRPSNVNYTNIGSEWTEIERSGKIPIVDWKNFKLMKISFQFVVGNPLRLTTSVDSELKTLRQMATSPYPVVIYGFDEMFNNDLRFPFSDTQTVEFAIAEMSISSVYRTPDNKINRATVDITLQELPIETVSVIEMPKLKFKDTVERPPTITPPAYGKRRTISEDYLAG